MSRAGAAGLVGALLAGAALAAGSAAPATAAGVCDRRLAVPGAERQVVTCLDDLTTKGTVPAGRSLPAHFGLLDAVGTQQPAAVVPGVQVDGYFPDDSRTNTTFGWDHDSQFVIRLPQRWNGGLVVAGTPGNRPQFANDRIIGDVVLAKGYAYAATDKGNTGAAFHADGATPADAVAEWHVRLTELARAAKRVAQQAYGRTPSTTFVTGLSNGGYLTRYQLENHPGLYDGGVDAEGTLFTDQDNLLRFLPPLLRLYPTYRDAPDAAAREAARQQLLAAGLPAGSEAQWEAYHAIYWDLTQRIFREELDPAFDGDTVAGTAWCTSGPACDAEYDYASRPAAREAVAEIDLDGKINDPLITVYGDQDALLLPARQGAAYAELVRQAKRTRYHRSYVVQGATHVDGLLNTPLALPGTEQIRAAYDAGQYRPLLPCYRAAFEQLERWVRDGVAPPPSGTIGRRASAAEELHAC